LLSFAPQRGDWGCENPGSADASDERGNGGGGSRYRTDRARVGSLSTGEHATPITEQLRLDAVPLRVRGPLIVARLRRCLLDPFRKLAARQPSCSVHRHYE